MTKRKLTEKRKKLLIELEAIIGNQCYNANIQNWGPGGVFEGEGREFRYPITFRDSGGAKVKARYVDDASDADKIINGYYAFGANELHIMEGLELVLSRLEQKYNIKF
ncbi:MAG: hypothetical protein AB7V13_23965 [Pseudorhodoplanes sp.]